MDYIDLIVLTGTNLIMSGGLFFGFFLVLLESFIPILPLSVFITLNVNAFGLFLGILISWCATSIGCFFCYLFFSFLEKKYAKKFLHKKTLRKIKKGMNTFQKITFPQLVLLITLPFTPAFVINILGGFSKISKEKFLTALIIGKMFSTTFWGYIGKSLLDSLTDLNSLIYIGIALLIAYGISKIVSLKLKIE